MTVIQVNNLSKVFHVQRKEPGLADAVKALFRPKYENKVAVVFIFIAYRIWLFGLRH